MSNEFKAGDRIVWNGDCGTFVRYEDRDDSCRWFPGKRVCIMKMDSDSHNDIEQEDEVEYVEPLVLLAVEDVAHVVALDGVALYSGCGHVIAEDGIVYSLTQRYCHGVVLAILYPEKAKEAGFAPPAKGAADVFKYQRFELDNQDQLPAIRVSLGWGFNISKGEGPATAAQLDGLRKVFKAHSKSLNDQVEMQCAPMTVRRCLQALERGDHV